MKKVGLAGYGTIGRRVADAIEMQSDMKVSGVAKTRPSVTARKIEKNFNLYGVSEENQQDMENEGHVVQGTLSDLCNDSDLIVDCSPSGYGEENKPVYEENDTDAIFQGGESASVADESFNSYVAMNQDLDYEDNSYLRIVSCNTTGLSRVISAIGSSRIEKVDATLIRRAGDPGETSRGPVNEVVRVNSVPSHHAEDVNELLPSIDIHTMAVKVPTTSMHMHSVSISLKDEDFSSDEFEEFNRLSFVPDEYDTESAGSLGEISLIESRPYGSIWENTIWSNTFESTGSELKFFQGIHQRSITVPETIDAIRALNGEDVEDSIRRTDESLGLDGSLFE